jgi:hypothetical protein
MAPITASTEVNLPAVDVYAYVTDPSLFAEWQKGVLRGHTEVGDGTAAPRCVTVRRIGFTDRASTSDIVQADPPRSWQVRGIDGPIRAQVEVTVEPLTNDRSRLTIAVDFDGHGIGKLLVPLIVRRQARTEMPANIAALKRRLDDSI